MLDKFVAVDLDFGSFRKPYITFILPRRVWTQKANLVNECWGPTFIGESGARKPFLTNECCGSDFHRRVWSQKAFSNK